MILAISIGCANSGYGPQGGWSGPTIGDPSNEIIFIANQTGEILALDKNKRGKIKWRVDYDDETSNPVYSTLTLGVEIKDENGKSADKIYFGTWEGHVIALNSKDGSEQWSYPLDDNPIIGDVFLDLNTEKDPMVYVGTSTGSLFALDVSTANETPTVVWEFQTEDKIWGTAIVHPTPDEIGHGILIIGSMDHNVYALNNQTGDELWRFETEGAITGTPLIVGSTLYVGSFDRRLYAIDLYSGNQKWQFETDGWLWNQFVVDSPDASSANLFIPSREGTLYALNQEGNLLWTYAAKSKVISSPAFTQDNELNLLAMVTEKGTLYVFDTETCPSNGSSCEPIWSYIIGEKVQAPLTISNSVVYVNAMDDSIRAIHLSENIELWNRSIAEED